MFNHILVGVDGSEHGFKAAKIAGELARAIGTTTVSVISCYEPLSVYMGAALLEQQSVNRIITAKANIQRAVEEIGALDCEVRTDTFEGPPAEKIIDIADSRNVDLIVIGTRGLGQLVGLLLGSQSQKVVAHAHCPVLLVR